tara:strand:+ start:794 stop:1114 length:321 start_codon:yes stop_codon:yes gene_type:complete
MQIPEKVSFYIPLPLAKKFPDGEDIDCMVEGKMYSYAGCGESFIMPSPAEDDFNELLRYEVWMVDNKGRKTSEVKINELDTTDEELIQDFVNSDEYMYNERVCSII